MPQAGLSTRGMNARECQFVRSMSYGDAANLSAVRWLAPFSAHGHVSAGQRAALDDLAEHRRRSAAHVRNARLAPGGPQPITSQRGNNLDAHLPRLPRRRCSTLYGL